MHNTKSKTKKLLTLGRETVRALSSAELLQVAGAGQSATCSHFATGCCWE